jgi:AAA+ ATPase superfamily predicted ATPase
LGLIDAQLLIHLSPFTLHECEDFLKSRNVSLNRYDIIESYMIFGGIPYYLGYFESNYSLAGNVDNIIFSENAPLKEEFQELSASLFKRSERYIEVVGALSRRTRGEDTPLSWSASDTSSRFAPGQAGVMSYRTKMSKFWHPLPKHGLEEGSAAGRPHLLLPVIFWNFYFGT